MAKLCIKPASKKETVNIFIQNSSSTTGAGLTGLAFDSASLTAYYSRQKGAATSITLATLASATANWSSGGFKEIDATNMPGLYRLDLPDAVLASGSRFATVMLKGATNMAPCLLEIDLNAQVSATATIATIRSGTAQSGSTSNTIKLDSGASSTDNLYVNNTIAISGGTGVGQTRTIIAYDGTTKVATVNQTWVTTPDNTSTFDLTASPGAPYSDQGLAQAGAAGTITLAATASASDDVYNSSFITILSGTGEGQTRVITDYNGTTKVATTDTNWSVTPDSTSAYAVIPAGTVASGSGSSGVVYPSAGEIAAATLSAAAADPISSVLADGVAHGGTPGSSTATFAMDRACFKTNGATAAFLIQNDGSGDAVDLFATGGGSGLTSVGSGSGSSIFLQTIAFGGSVGPCIYMQPESAVTTGANSGVVVIDANGASHGVSILAGVGKHDINLAGSGDILGDLNGSVLDTGTVADITIESGISASAALTNDTGTQLTSITLSQAIAVILAACGAKLTGPAGPTTVMYPAAKPAAAPRISAAVDQTSGRTAVTLKVPD